MRRLAVGASLLTMVATSFAYTGAVARGAFFGFVLVAALSTGLLTAVVGQPHQLGGLLTGLVVAVGWSVCVNALSGETSGPVARSSVVCGLSTALGVYSARRLSTAPFLLAVVLSMAGALYYGSAGETRPLALAVAALALLSSGAIDVARHERRPARPGVAVLAVGGLLVALLLTAAVGAQAAITRAFGRDSALSSTLVEPAAIRPPWSARPPSAPVGVPSTTVAPTATTLAPSGTALQNELLNLVLVLALALLGLLAVLVGVRLLVGQYRLVRWKRRLRSLQPGERTTAAWTWMTFHLDRLGWTPRANPSIDMMADDVARLRWPEPIRVPAVGVAALGTSAAFAQGPCNEDDAVSAWDQAERAVRAARECSGRLRRTKAFLWLLRT